VALSLGEEYDVCDSTTVHATVETETTTDTDIHRDIWTDTHREIRTDTNTEIHTDRWTVT